MSAGGDRARALEARREVLLARSARLRDELADGAHEIGTRFRVFDRGVALGRRTLAFGRSRLVLPLVVAGGVALLVARPSRWLRLASRAFVLWPIVRPFLPQLIRYVQSQRASR
jgi:hypothetical protein